MELTTIYDQAIRAVSSGCKFNINFQTRSLKLGRRFLIKNSEYSGDLGLKPDDTETFISTVENLYRRYKHSTPSEQSESKRKKYFISLPEDKLEDNDMMFGVNRNVAQIELELYILIQILLGFQWQESMGKWFWQSNNDKDLVILKQWINN